MLKIIKKKRNESAVTLSREASGMCLNSEIKLHCCGQRLLTPVATNIENEKDCGDVNHRLAEMRI